MGYVCAIAGGKGGVGKTTTAINLAVTAAEDHDVVLLDADLGMANVGRALDLDREDTLHDVLAGEARLSDVLVDGSAGPAVVVGEGALDAYADADPAALRDVVEVLRSDYDLVVVDTGAGLSHEVLVPLGLADGILLVTTPGRVALEDTIKTVDLADRVDGTVLGAVLTRASPETDIEAIAADLPVPLLGVVPEDRDAAATEPLVRDASDAPAAAAYRRLSGTLEPVFFDGAGAADLGEPWQTPDFPGGTGRAPARTGASTGADADTATAAPADDDDSTSPEADDSVNTAEGADDETETASTDETDTDSGGVFGLFR